MFHMYGGSVMQKVALNDVLQSSGCLYKLEQTNLF